MKSDIEVKFHGGPWDGETHRVPGGRDYIEVPVPEEIRQKSVLKDFNPGWKVCYRIIPNRHFRGFGDGYCSSYFDLPPLDADLFN